MNKTRFIHLKTCNFMLFCDYIVMYIFNNGKMKTNDYNKNSEYNIFSSD